MIRTAVGRAMREMGRQFVLGEDIGRAMKRAKGMEAKGYTYSYDMLGEAARTEADARAYHLAYSRAIAAIAAAAIHGSVAANPGISVKLSALHPRYEVAQQERVMDELVPRVRALAGLAKAAGMGFNIDAEEADRLALSLDVIEAVLADRGLSGWDGFGVVVQAYGQRAPASSSTGWTTSPSGSTGGSWCAWSRAPTGTPRSSARRSRGWRAFRSSPARPRPTSAISPTRASCSA